MDLWYHMNQEAHQQKLYYNGIDLYIIILGCNSLEMVNFNILIMEELKIEKFMDLLFHQNMM